MIKSRYNGKRLSITNLLSYLQEQHPEKAVVCSKEKLLKVNAYTQDKFGEDNDCALCAVMTICKYYASSVSAEEIYSIVEKNAKALGYRSKWGTFIGVQRLLLQRSLNDLGIPQDARKLICCHDHDKIKNIIDTGHPVLLSFLSDGRNYYGSHSVTVVGYKDFDINGATKTVYKIYDNWTKNVSYLDLDNFFINLLVY